MACNGFAKWFGIACLVAVVIQPHISRAGLHHYSFVGEVTSLENSSGYFAVPVTVGAQLGGNFTYTDTPFDGSDEFSPFVTFYLHDRSISPLTELVLGVGGGVASSSAFSLTNMVIGNDNTDPLPPFFPEGDFFRYLDELDRDTSLFDFSGAALEQFPFGNIFLADSTGNAFASQGLPHGLPLASFDQQHGNILIFDEESELTGMLEFRIDSIQAVPEPSTAVLLLAGLLAIAGVTAMPSRK